MAGVPAIPNGKELAVKQTLMEIRSLLMLTGAFLVSSSALTMTWATDWSLGQWAI
jgi:hypothetical protein